MTTAKKEATKKESKTAKKTSTKKDTKTTDSKSLSKSSSVKTATSVKTVSKPSEQAKQSTKVESNNATEPVVEPAVENEVVDEDIQTSKSIIDSFNQLIEFHKQQRSLQTAEIARIRTMKSQYERQFKSLHKKASKKRRTNKGVSESNGFKRPTNISDELCDFFGKPHGTLMARTDVTRELSNYIRENKLQDPMNGRNILPDQKLRKLLRIGKTDELNIFNMQTFMVPHYPPKMTASATAK